ncbi:MAG: tRNA (adenosine(37)-N6)-threonylcarbamoyltransferase complex dimerization subunit type 1 TsaB [Clostridiales bacterium]|nr:tRNA (adenosine(37)-N6)-threonylcarbamoyltransferase complex dimerization subunit type 1 TsaB [Clostridiales bacterium]
MIILGIDTSAKTSTMAVCSQDKVIVSGAVHTQLTHSQTLLPMVKSMLNSASISLDEIDAFAVSIGPGSFTGLRIGISAIKGFAYALDRPCIGVSSLEALAYNLRGLKGKICAVMDARRNQVYNAVFEFDGDNLIRLCDDRVIMIDELGAELGGFPPNEEIHIVGDGADLVMAQLTQKNLAIAPPHLKFQLGASVCAAAFKGEKISAQELSPSYLRIPQAQRELQAKNLEK